MKRLFMITVTVFVLLFITATPVMAAVGNVTTFTATATTTTISFRLNLPSGATSSVVRYSTTAYPATTADGTGVTMTNKYYATITGLTAGTTYYFSVWGWDEAVTYSPAAYNFIITLPFADVPTGESSSNYRDVPTIPSLPGNMASAPSVAGIDVYPYNLIIDNLNNAPGGLGIPSTTSWELTISFLIALAGVVVYALSKSLLAGNVTAIMLSYGAWQAGLTQLYGIIFFIIVALGMWALEGMSARG